MNQLASILIFLVLPSMLGGTTLADPPTDTGLDFKVIKADRNKKDDTGFDLLTVRITNESKSNYWIMTGEKDPVERFSKTNPDALIYLMHHSFTTDHGDHYHVRKGGNWKRIHPLGFRRTTNERWIKIGPGDRKEMSIPVADTLVDHAAKIDLTMFFSRDEKGQSRFHLVSNAVIVKAHQPNVPNHPSAPRAGSEPSVRDSED